MEMTVIQILSFCLLITATWGQYPNSNIDRFSKSIASPRVSYSTSIIHNKHDSNDQQAESSINVNFEAQKLSYNTHKPVANGVFNQNDPTKNLFNVGYSVSFQNTPKSVSHKKGVSSMRNHNLNNGEVITGTIKQNVKVKAPEINVNMTPQEFVSHALLKQKHLISGIKPKYPLPPDGDRYKSTKVVSSEEVKHFSPKLQHHIKSLEKTKAMEIENHKYKNNQQNLYTNWKNLSPGVEIVKSAEIPYTQKDKQNQDNFEKTVNQKYTVSQYVKANSDSNPESSQIEYNKYKTTKPRYELISEEFKNSNDEIGYSIPHSSDYEPYQPPSSIDNSEPYLSTEVDQLPKMDTTLLREPVIITNLNDIPTDPKVVPIHFDLKPLEVAMTQQGAMLQPHNNIFMHAYVYGDQTKRKYNFKADGSPESIENDNLPQQKSRVQDSATSQSEHQYRYYGAPDYLPEIPHHQHETFMSNAEKPRQPRVIKDNKWTPIESTKPKSQVKNKKPKDSDKESDESKEMNVGKEKPIQAMRYTKVRQHEPKGPPKPEKPKDWHLDNKPTVGLRPKEKSREKPRYRINQHKIREYQAPSLGYSFF